MKNKLLKGLAVTFLSFTTIIFGAFVYLIILSQGVSFDKNKLVSAQSQVTFYDCNNEKINSTFQSNGINYTKISEVNKDTINAFISTEDKRFYSHNGIDYKRLAKATLNNVTSLSFKEGASTISQQLIKNTHLSSKKTLKRKAQEVRLTISLEREFSKDEILEKYLNTIYFGENCYGIASASSKFFGKKVSDLSLEESATLAGIIKGPTTYSPIKNNEKCLKRRNLVLNLMLKQNKITQNQFEKAIATKINLDNYNSSSNCEPYLTEAFKEFEKENSFYPYRNKTEYKIYTYLDKGVQEICENAKMNIGTDESIIILDNSTYSVLGYYSTCGEINRSPASTIKPILVYAPALEYNQVSPMTQILDEKININGYSPKNVNDDYKGYVSVKDALSKSINIPAVKLLNDVGLQKCIKFAKNNGIRFDEKDNTLSIALGGFTNGITLKELTNSYLPFSNGGYYDSCKFIKKVEDKKGKIIYKRKNIQSQTLREDTAYLMTDMLKSSISDGTLKKLRSLSLEIAGKSGTNGNDNGNLDAYSITYSKNYTLGVWLGNKSGKLMGNNISGGSYPANISYNIWSNLSQTKNLGSFDIPDSVITLDIDKNSYEKEHTLLLADDNAPKEQILSGYFSKNNKPTKISQRFSNPKIENIEINTANDSVCIRVCLAYYLNFNLFREENGKNKIIKSGKGNDSVIEIIDKPKKDREYTYSIVPYYINKDGKKIYGEKIVLPKIYLRNNFDDYFVDNYYN